MPEQKNGTGWDFLINWLLLSLVGFFLGLSTRSTAFELIFRVMGEQTTGKVAEGVVIGVAIGLAQSMALPPRVPRSSWWAIAATLGWGLGWGFGWHLVLTLSGGFTFVFVLVGGLSGFLAGLIQWRLLQPHFSQAIVWIGGSTLGWAAGLGVGMGIGGMLGWPLGGGVAGLITGATLVWLLQSLPAAEPNPPHL